MCVSYEGKESWKEGQRKGKEVGKADEFREDKDELEGWAGRKEG